MTGTTRSRNATFVVLLLVFLVPCLCIPLMMGYGQGVSPDCDDDGAFIGIDSRACPPRIGIWKDDRVVILPNDQVNSYECTETLTRDSAYALFHSARVRAEAYLEANVTKAVITVPKDIMWNETRRDIIKAAGADAGLFVLLRDESTAAGIAHGLDEPRNWHHSHGTTEAFALVYTLGETFNIDLVEVDLGVFETLATSGRVQYGPVSDSGCSEVAGSESPDSSASCKTGVVDSDLAIKSRQAVDQVLKEAKLEKKDLTHLIMVGDLSYSPNITSSLEAYLGIYASTVASALDARVLGATAQAYYAFSGWEGCDLPMMDVNILSLGFETASGLMTVVIPRNTPMPNLKTQFVIPACDNQTSIVARMFTGERALAGDNFYVGSVELELPSMVKGRRNVEIAVELDADYVVIVHVRDLSTGNKSSSEFPDPWQVDVDTLDQLILDAERNHEQDAMLRLLWGEYATNVVGGRR